MKKTADFFYELGQLRRVKRSGWWMAGIKDPESVAEHSHRAAIIAYFIARLEKADPYKAVMMVLFHDMPESRVNDLHKVGQRYIDLKEAEEKAFREQISGLGIDIANELAGFYSHYGADTSAEGTIARDADLLECAVTAREYVELGCKEAQDWISNIEKLLKTDSAGKLLNSLQETCPCDWWKGLKRIRR